MPFIPFTNAYLDGDCLAVTGQERSSTSSTLGALGTSFLNVWKHSADRATFQLLQVIQHMCDFTIVLENYVQGRPVSRPPAALTDQRNFTQHALISLLSAQEIENEHAEVCDVQYESCRLACIVYSLLVVFPLPPMVGYFERVTARLQESLLRMKPGGIQGDSRRELQVWILTMGATISIGLPERTWFLNELATTVQPLRIRDPETFTGVLQGFLWHPKTNSRDGLKLWRELPVAKEARRDN